MINEKFPVTTLALFEVENMFEVQQMRKELHQQFVAYLEYHFGKEAHLSGENLELPNDAEEKEVAVLQSMGQAIIQRAEVLAKDYFFNPKATPEHIHEKLLEVNFFQDGKLERTELDNGERHIKVVLVRLLQDRLTLRLNIQGKLTFSDHSQEIKLSEIEVTVDYEN